jgi:hypothetical protein
MHNVSDFVRVSAACFGFTASLGCLIIMGSLSDPRPEVQKARRVANLALATAGVGITWGNMQRLGQPITGPTLVGICAMCLALWYVALMVNAPTWRDKESER